MEKACQREPDAELGNQLLPHRSTNCSERLVRVGRQHSTDDSTSAVGNGNSKSFPPHLGRGQFLQTGILEGADGLGVAGGRRAGCGSPSLAYPIASGKHQAKRQEALDLRQDRPVMFYDTASIVARKPDGGHRGGRSTLPRRPGSDPR